MFHLNYQLAQSSESRWNSALLLPLFDLIFFVRFPICNDLFFDGVCTQQHSILCCIINYWWLPAYFLSKPSLTIVKKKPSKVIQKANFFFRKTVNIFTSYMKPFPAIIFDSCEWITMFVDDSTPTQEPTTHWSFHGFWNLVLPTLKNDKSSRCQSIY